MAGKLQATTTLGDDEMEDLLAAHDLHIPSLKPR